MRVKDITFEEAKDIMKELKEFHINYTVEKDPLMVRIKTNGYIYRLNLIGQKLKNTSPKAISREFKAKTHYNSIEGKYGYKYKVMKRSNKTRVIWDYQTACGYADANPYYARKWITCWSYDVNSAFSFAMLKPMPDTTKEPRYNDYVRPFEMGFYKGGGATTAVGDWADIIFPLTDSPFKNYVLEYYEKKEHATDKKLRQMWKDYLNIPTGCIQRHNIFLRNAIIYYSNEYIKKYIDKNTVYCNVDCIVSLVPRPDIPIGNDIGYFKCEHANERFKYIDTGMYQWNDECHYKGVPGDTITDIEHIENWYQVQLSKKKYDYDEEKGEFILCQNVVENPSE